MEFDINDLYTFIAVSVISSACISIGIGGGILYVPILGYIFEDIAYGVYLSKLSVLISSSLALVYHVYHDVRTKKDESSETEFVPPRVHVLLAVSVIPWCMLGSFFGVAIHFKAKKYLRVLLTIFVSVTATISLCKLAKAHLPKAQDPPPEDPKDVETLDNVEENRENVGGQQRPSAVDIRPYDVSDIHGDTQRIVGCVLIVGMILCYYLSLEVPCPYFGSILRGLCILVGIFYSAKIRNSIKVQGDRSKFSWIRKVFSNQTVRVLFKIIVAVICGLLSGILGIGAGIFIVPLLQFLLLPPISVAATSNLLTLALAIISTLKFKTAITYTCKMVVPTVLGSLIGSGTSIFVIRKFTKDKFSNSFINIILFLVCAMSIVLIWTL